MKGPRPFHLDDLADVDHFVWSGPLVPNGARDQQTHQQDHHYRDAAKARAVVVIEEIAPQEDRDAQIEPEGHIPIGGSSGAHGQNHQESGDGETGDANQIGRIEKCPSHHPALSAGPQPDGLGRGRLWQFAVLHIRRMPETGGCRREPGEVSL